MPEALDILERQVKDLERKNEALLKDNGGQRDELREARDTVKTLEAERDDVKQKLPADGSLVLGKADAERWNSYTALGKLDEVTAKVNGYGNLEAKEQRRTREDGIKALGFKPSIFELIAEGKTYRAEGEGDDRKVLVSVDDKEQELTAYATERGLGDLLGVMGLTQAPETPKVPTPTGAGTRKPGEFKALSADERAKQKQNEGRYSGL